MRNWLHNIGLISVKVNNATNLIKYQFQSNFGPIRISAKLVVDRAKNKNSYCSEHLFNSVFHQNLVITCQCSTKFRTLHTVKFYPGS